MSEQTPFVAPFIVLEGDEGTGKSEVAKLVVALLREKGIEVVHTREPGGTELGELIRAQLLLKREVPLEKTTHILLHQAYRAEHINKVIMPAITSGKVVLCERFFMSTIALNIMPYRETHPELYELFMGTMPAVAGNLVEPVTFLLDVPEEQRKLRLLGREELDHYESRTAEELQLTSDAYKMFQQHPTTITIDGSKPLADLAGHIVAQIEAQIAAAKEQAAEFERQQEECSIDPAFKAASEQLCPEVVAEPEPEPPFDLVAAIEDFLDENLTSALFNGDASQIERYRPAARSLILTVWNGAQDPVLFKGNYRIQLRQKLHSIIHYGHQLDLIRDAKPETPAVAAE